MLTIGLIGLVIALIFISLYMCVHSVSKNTTIVAFVIVSFISVAFMVVGYILLGTKAGDELKWSFILSVISAFFCLLAGILAVVQMRSAGVWIIIISIINCLSRNNVSTYKLQKCFAYTLTSSPKASYYSLYRQ